MATAAGRWRTLNQDGIEKIPQRHAEVAQIRAVAA